MTLSIGLAVLDEKIGKAVSTNVDTKLPLLVLQQQGAIGCWIYCPPSQFLTSVLRHPIRARI